MKPQSVLVVGGAGYCGSVLVPKLLAAGHRVTVYDNLTFGNHLPPHTNLRVFKGDVRDCKRYKSFLGAVYGCDAVIHLACVSNDPSAEVDPELTKAVNLDAFDPCVRVCREAFVRRFIFASSSSVYGASDAPSVTESHALAPLTDYSLYKVECEKMLFAHDSDSFACTAVRPGTLMGASPRMRFDLSVNGMAHQAVTTGAIKVCGPSLKRCPTHVEDVCELYLRLLDPEVVGVSRGQVFNAGATNHTLGVLAHAVKGVVEDEFQLSAPVDVRVTDTDDLRSYHIDSSKARNCLGWLARRTVRDAAREVCRAFRDGMFPDPDADRFFNVRTLRARATRAPSRASSREP